MKMTSALVVAGMLAFSGSAFAASTNATVNATTPAANATVKATATTPAASTTAPAATTKPAMAAPQQTAASKKCSADADAKGLHGKERKKFRADCMAMAKKS